MKEKEDNYIKIPVMLYNDLIKTKQNYGILVDYIFDNCRLSYDKERLVFDEYLLLLKYLCAFTYNCKLEELQGIKDNKEN